MRHGGVKNLFVKTVMTEIHTHSRVGHVLTVYYNIERDLHNSTHTQYVPAPSKGCQLKPKGW